MADEQKTAIIRKFLRSSPPGEINDVYNALRSLVEDDALLEPIVQEAFKQYNLEQYLTVKLPGSDHKTVLSTKAELHDDVYLDPRQKKTFTFDHIQHTVDQVEAYSDEGPNESLRVAVDEAASKYLADHYKEGSCSVLDGSTISIIFVNDRFNPNNYWNGKWRSSWELNAQTGDLHGVVFLNIHYYEDGNVQLQTEHKASTQIQVSDDHSAMAAAALHFIRGSEAEYQQQINDRFGIIADSHFRSLRRALPITKSKINWDAIATYKIGNEMGK